MKDLIDQNRELIRLALEEDIGDLAGVARALQVHLDYRRTVALGPERNSAGGHHLAARAVLIKKM